MKKPVSISMIAVLTCIPVIVRAGQNGSTAQDRGSESSKMSGKPTSLSGKVGTDGKTLTADKDGRIWTVSNPEVLSGINGRHVEVRHTWTRPRAEFKSCRSVRFRRNEPAQSSATLRSEGERCRNEQRVAAGLSNFSTKIAVEAGAITGHELN